MMTLNPSEYTVSSISSYGASYWNRQSSTCYSGSSSGTKSCNFSSTGLTAAARAMIAQTTFYLGGRSASSGSVYAKTFYNSERGTTVGGSHHTTWNGYVGLMYPSDYLYATDLSVCTKVTYNSTTSPAVQDYRDSTCYSNDWLHLSSNEWVLTPSSYNAYRSFYKVSSGYITTSTYPYTARVVRPVVYLKANIQIDTDGKDGSNSTPYGLIDPDA